MSEEKKELRKAMRLRAQGLSPARRQAWSLAIARRALALPQVERAQSIFLFWGMEGEVDTRPLMDELCRRGKQVFLPRVVGKGEMIPVRYFPGCPMEKGAFSIPEPVGEEMQGPIDLVLAPGLAFDREGGRLGQGGGFYDRFLQRHKAPAIALTFENQMVARVPREVHDRKMELVITQRTVYKDGKELEIAETGF